MVDLERKLNRDELEVMSLLLDGYNTKQIGQQMNITLNDVYYIFSHLKSKITEIREAA
ncbi:MAG: LuxR C-terminal-related transcriptional regulator [Odoribacter sp.]|nr:LuxR C-terminal-related transcriptional regulator [Odoribacter sp.]